VARIADRELAAVGAAACKRIASVKKKDDKRGAGPREGTGSHVEAPMTGATGAPEQVPRIDNIGSDGGWRVGLLVWWSGLLHKH
jgi:hypothetical protein